MNLLCLKSSHHRKYKNTLQDGNPKTVSLIANVIFMWEQDKSHKCVWWQIRLTHHNWNTKTITEVLAASPKSKARGYQLIQVHHTLNKNYLSCQSCTHSLCRACADDLATLPSHKGWCIMRVLILITKEHPEPGLSNICSKCIVINILE